MQICLQYSIVLTSGKLPDEKYFWSVCCSLCFTNFCVGHFSSDVDGDNEGVSNVSDGDGYVTTNDLLSSLADVGHIYQMVSNADGSMSLVALDSSHLTSLLQGNTNGMHHYEFIVLELKQV